MHSGSENFIVPFYYSKIKRIQAISMHAPHCHNHFEVYYLLDGERKYFIENSIYSVKPGDVVLIPAEALHKTTELSKGGHERILINVAEDWVTEDVRGCFSCHCLHIPPAQRPEIEGIFRRIEQEYQHHDSFSGKLQRQALYELLVFLIRLKESRPSAAISNREDTVIEKAAQYICEHYQEPLTLQTVAQEVSMSREYFSQRFKKMTGFGFCEYLNEIRIANAVKLLNTTQMTITEVAYSCGFNDSNYFATVFKKSKGMNPKKYQGSRL